MITISVIKETPCEVVISELQSRVEHTLRANGVISDAEVSVVLVDRAQMLSYVEKHLQETGEEAAAHPVLSFVQNELEGPFVNPPDGVTHLGEIIVSFPHAEEDAKLQNKTTQEVVCELSEHAALHLMGVHHD